MGMSLGLLMIWAVTELVDMLMYVLTNAKFEECLRATRSLIHSYCARKIHPPNSVTNRCSGTVHNAPFLAIRSFVYQES
jgi:hypothetical protein